MESIYGISNWKLTVRRAPDHVEILRALSCDTNAVLPDELFSLPVTVLGKHALSPSASETEGEEVRIICGAEGEWDNRNIGSLTLPAGLRDVGNYALYGCRSLHTLRLHDTVERWGGGCLMNCGQLRRIHLTRTGDKQGESLAFLCGEIHEELDVSICGAEGSITRLLFPDFAEAYEENFANHHFDYSIMGGGFPYHHVFRSKQLFLSDYDALWDKYLSHDHDEETATRLAFMRLRWPHELSCEAEERYVSYLRSKAARAILWQLSQRDGEGLSLLLERLAPDENVLHLACEQARREENTEALALLLEKQRKHTARGFDRDFDL